MTSSTTFNVKKITGSVLDTTKTLAKCSSTFDISSRTFWVLIPESKVVSCGTKRLILANNTTLLVVVHVKTCQTSLVGISYKYGESNTIEVPS